VPGTWAWFTEFKEGRDWPRCVWTTVCFRRRWSSRCPPRRRSAASRLPRWVSRASHTTRSVNGRIRTCRSAWGRAAQTLSGQLSFSIFRLWEGLIEFHFLFKDMRAPLIRIIFLNLPTRRHDVMGLLWRQLMGSSRMMKSRRTSPAKFMVSWSTLGTT